MDKILITWDHTGRLLLPMFENLDPSLFQNIVIGILAIFIPFAIVFLTDVLDSRKERSEFEKLVLSEEVFGTKSIFWVSVIAIGIFSFFSGTTVSIAAKLLAVFILLVTIYTYWKSFKRVLRFSEGYKSEFELRFLRGLKSKYFGFGNQLRRDRMVRSWNSYWAVESKGRIEREFTSIFIDHIDDLIDHRRYDLAVTLLQTYSSNIDKRDRFSIGHDILPKFFEWHYRMLKTEQRWLRDEVFKDKLIEIMPAKHLPTFTRWLSILLNKISHSRLLSWNFVYFPSELFPVIIVALLKDHHGPYQLFTEFKKHIDATVALHEAAIDKDIKQRHWNLIEELSNTFFPSFFNTIDTAPAKHDIWGHYFPPEWRITHNNVHNQQSRLVLFKFLKWSRDRLLSDSQEYDKNLSEVVGGLFPNVHHTLFPAFLILHTTGSVKSAIKREPRFYLANTHISYNEEKSEEELSKMFAALDKEQRDETIDVILDYFNGYWQVLRLFTNDMSEKERLEWQGYPESKRQQIVRRVRKKKLQSILSELKSPEIVGFCKEEEKYEYQRQDLIQLITLLLAKV